MTRIKGITIWEQYVEFGVLGVVAILFVAFTAMQFIGQPNAVDIAGRGKVAPGNIDRLLEEEARRIESRLRPEADPPVNIPPPESVADEFLARLTAPASPGAARPFPIVQVPPRFAASEVEEGVVFAEPAIPEPKTVLSRQYFDALSELAIQAHADLQERLGEPPYDVTWATVAASFNVGEILRQYRTGGRGDDIAPIPQSWHSDRINIVNVIIEREELVQGQWTNQTIVEPIPGQLHFRNELAGDIDSARRDMILNLLRQHEVQRSLVQPEFLDTRNSVWQPPDPLAEDIELAEDDEQRVRILERRLARDRQEKETVQRELDELPAGGGAAPPGGGGGGGARQPPGGGRAPGTGMPPPGGGPSVGPSGSDRPSGRNLEIMRSELEQRLQRLERRIESTMNQLRELRPEVDPDEIGADFADLNELAIWGHDLDVEHGSTYRYRVAVELYNPFFARSLHLVDEQAHLADSFTIQSGFSEWSEPINIRPPVHVFVTRAYPQGHNRLGALGARSFGEAAIEVFRFHDGRWWESRFTVAPGQRVGAVREEGARGEGGRLIDYGTDWFVLDILRDFEADASQYEDGRGAVVVLQHLKSADVMEIRHPLKDSSSELRQRLRAEIQVALRE